MRNLFILFIFTSLLVQGAEPSGDRLYEVTRAAEAPQIDGILSDPAWLTAEKAGNFVQTSPSPGEPAHQHTEVYVVYDNVAVYIAARMYDVSGDSVMTQLAQRDDYTNCDWFGVGFDTYNNDINAFIFAVYATGVQFDAVHRDGFDDNTWNAVWQSAVSIVEDGWIAEIKIPYSALRFPEAQVQDWGMNFSREVRRIREQSSWSYIDPNVSGQVNQWGSATGIENIEAPVRLSFSPYVSGYLEHFPYGISDVDDWSTSYNGGMDVKYGINDAFTLDMTLIPDFGQTKFDNRVLNLSPFEVRYNENRQFFTEGLEMFDDELFYSRRVGAMPIGFWSAYSQAGDEETVVDNPTSSQLINATKVSGRTDSGLGIGVFNGVTKAMYATIQSPEGKQRKVLTDPLTNYNVVVFDQQLVNNSSVTLTNTNVWREGNYYDANVSGLDFDLYDKNIAWNLYGGGAASQLYGITEEGEAELGYTYYGGLSNVAGQWNYGVDFGIETDKYDPNDLGFLYNNNSQWYGTYVSYNTYEPKGKFLRTWRALALNYSRLYNPNVFTDFSINMDAGATFRNFMTAGGWGAYWPTETYDYFEPRVQGRYFTYNPGVAVGGFISSDYSKPFALDVNGSLGKFIDQDRLNIDISISPRMRFSDKFMLILSVARFDNINDLGSAIDNYYYSPTFIGEDIIFAKRDRVTYENTVSGSYIFNNKMGVTLTARHYWSTVKYEEFYALTNDGYLEEYPGYDGLDAQGNSLHDISYNAFTIDLVYQWVFAPGSQLSLVYKNFIETEGYKVDPDYFANFSKTLKAEQLNSFSVKVLYYIDYLYFKKRQ